MNNNPIGLETACVRANVYLTSALLTDVEFALKNGQWVKPLASPFWPVKPQLGLMGHMQRLSGEFFCLPFGGSGMVNRPTKGWEGFADEPTNSPLHGPCANEDWFLAEAHPDHVALRLDFPEDHAIQSVERHISLSATRSRVDIEIKINARKSTFVPAAFHPILRLPQVSAELNLIAEFSLGLTYPGVIESDRMITEPGREFYSLDKVPRRHRGTVDLSKLPIGPVMEDVVLMAGVLGPIHVNFVNEGFKLILGWSREYLPHCMLWIHDRGIDSEP